MKSGGPASAGEDTSALGSQGTEAGLGLVQRCPLGQGMG